MLNEESLKVLQSIIDKSENIVFFGGAGVSTESGIPDFRSTDGLYASTYKNKSPETILSAGFFKEDPETFYKFFREKLLMEGSDLKIEPNDGHLKLAELEKCGKLKAIITQNIDTLHQEAGSKEVYQIHGTIATYHCLAKNHKYDIDFVRGTKGIPKCPQCKCMLKPDVVLYDESLPMDVWAKSVEAVSKADCLIVAGTSLTVYPAASLLDFFRGDNLVIINRDMTPHDTNADLVIHDSIGKVLSSLKV